MVIIRCHYTRYNLKDGLKGKVAINEVITYIEGVKVNKSTDFSVELLKHAPNDTIEITVCGADGTNTRNVNITLIKR